MPLSRREVELDFVRVQEVRLSERIWGGDGLGGASLDRGIGRLLSEEVGMMQARATSGYL